MRPASKCSFDDDCTARHRSCASRTLRISPPWSYGMPTHEPHNGLMFCKHETVSGLVHANWKERNLELAQHTKLGKTLNALQSAQLSRRVVKIVTGSRTRITNNHCDRGHASRTTSWHISLLESRRQSVRTSHKLL
jgi:hypothetical protein